MEDSIQIVQDSIAAVMPADTTAVVEAVSQQATGVTSQTWLVTGLGFGIVLILLFCFVFIMKGLGSVMQRLEEKPASAPKKAANTTYATDADGATKAAIATALNMNASDEEKAAVAYAMHLYYNSLHDIEAPRLTLTHHCEAWNRK